VIPAGRSLAVVGANGAGKTTLVKLLARLYDPTDGRITVDGNDLATLDARRATSALTPAGGGVWSTAVAVLVMAALGAVLWWLAHLLAR